MLMVLASGKNKPRAAREQRDSRFKNQRREWQRRVEIRTKPGTGFVFFFPFFSVLEGGREKNKNKKKGGGGMAAERQSYDEAARTPTSKTKGEMPGATDVGDAGLRNVSPPFCFFSGPVR